MALKSKEEIKTYRRYHMPGARDIVLSLIFISSP